jgi:hypothetical protein
MVYKNYHYQNLDYRQIQVGMLNIEDFSNFTEIILLNLRENSDYILKSWAEDTIGRKSLKSLDNIFSTLSNSA